MENNSTVVDKAFNEQKPDFTPELENLLRVYGNNVPGQSLKRFLSVQAISEMTEELLDDENWEMLEIATAAIFLERKDEDLLDQFLGTLGTYLYNNYEQNKPIEKSLVEGFYYASENQLAKGLEILAKLAMQFDYLDDFDIALFYKNLKDSLEQNQQINRVDDQLESKSYLPLSRKFVFIG